MGLGFVPYDYLLLLPNATPLIAPVRVLTATPAAMLMTQTGVLTPPGVLLYYIRIIRILFI